MRPESGFQIALNWPEIKKNENDVTIFWNKAIVKFFWRCRIPLVKFSYWCKFYANIITDSLFIRDWPGIRKLPYLSFTQYLETGAS